MSARVGLAAFLLAACVAAACSNEGTALPRAAGDSGAPDASIGEDAGTLVTQGAAFTLARDCAQCHHGDGDGPLSGNTSPVRDSTAFAKNLTPDPDTGIDGWKDADYTRAILDGIDDQGVALCLTMPRFRDKGMTDSEAAAIAAYLKSLPPVHHYVPESVCVRPALDGGSDDASDGGSDAGADAALDAADASTDATRDALGE
jgi:mono/diheme cytochrome c family protein